MPTTKRLQAGSEAIKVQCKPETATIAFKVKRCNFHYSSEYFASVDTEVDNCRANTRQPWQSVSNQSNHEDYFRFQLKTDSN